MLTCVSVSRGQAVAVSSFSCCPSESTGELISPSFAEMQRTSDSSSNCRATDLLPDDSDAAFSTSQPGMSGSGTVATDTHRCDFVDTQ